jgi:hypothetical protein
MPPLEGAPLPIPLSGGLAQNVDARVLPPGSYAVLENLVQSAAGAFEKRYGFAAVSDAHSGGTVENPTLIATYQSRPVCLSVPDTSPPEVYQHDGALWQSKGQAELGRVLLRQEIARPQGTVFYENMHRSNIAGRNLVTTLWTESELGLTSPDVAARICYRVVDGETGVEVVRRTLLSLTTSAPFASAAVGTKIVLAQVNAGSTAYVLTSIDPATGVSTSLATVSAASIVGTPFDVAAYDANTFIFVYKDGGGIRTDLRNVTTGAVGASVTAGITNAGLLSAAFLAGSPNQIFVFGESSGALRGTVLTSTGPTNLLNTLGTVTVDAAAGALLRLGAGAIDIPGFGPAGFAIATPATNQTTKMYVTDASLALSVSETLPWSILTSKPVLVNERLWCTMAMHASVVQTSLGLTQVATTCLVSLEVGEEFINPRLCAVLGRLRSIYDTTNVTTTSALATGGAGQFDCPTRVFVGVGLNLRFGIDRTRVTVNQYALGSHQNDACQGAVAFSGAHVGWLDGQSIFELGFVQDPRIISVQQVVGSGSIPIGEYDVCACYEYQDGAGNLHRSAPSAPVRVSVAANNTRLTINIATTGLTGSLGGVRRPILIHVFRTLAGPSPDFFRLTSSSTALRNTTTTNTLSFLTGDTDAFVQSLGLGLLYTNVERPARTPPPASAVLSHRGRLFLASAEDRGVVFYSKPINGPGLAPEFADELSFILPDAIGPVTALAALDAAVVAFTESQAYVISGEGRTATGGGGDFFVAKIPTEHGCFNAASVAATQEAVFFQAGRGICAIGRDQTVRYIGAAVETIIGQTHRIIRSVTVDQRRRRVIWLSRSAQALAAQHLLVVLDLDTQIWTTWRLEQIVTGQAFAEDQHWVSTFGAAFGRSTPNQADLAASSDFGLDYIRTILETPWINVSGLVGHQRTRRWAIQANVPDPCVLIVDVMVDFNEASTQTFTIDLSDATRVEDRLNARISEVIAVQRHSAIKLRFADVPIDAQVAGRGLSYAALMLEIAGMRGLAKTAAGNRS